MGGGLSILGLLGGVGKALPKVGGGAAELRQPAAEGAGELGKLRRAEDEQRDDQDDHELGEADAEHRSPNLARFSYQVATPARQPPRS